MINQAALCNNKHIIKSNLHNINLPYYIFSSLNWPLLDMRKWRLLVFLIILININVYSQEYNLKIKTTEDSLTGNFKFNSRKQYSNELEARIYLQELLTELYQQGHITATIDTFIEDSTTLIANLMIGKSYHWVNLNPGNVDDDWLRSVGFRSKQFENKKFDFEKAVSLIESLLRYAENQGYPFAEVKFDSFNIKDDEVSARLNLDKNSLIIFDSIEYTANAGINRKFIQNYLGIKYGAIYREDLVLNVGKKLTDIQFITLLKEPEVLFYNNKAQIHFAIKHKQANSFNGVVGINPQNQETKKVSLNGFMDFKVINPFARGMQIGLYWNKTLINNQTLSIAYQYPYFLNLPLGIDLGLKILKNDTLYFNVDTKIGINYFISASRILKLFYENSSSTTLTSSIYNKTNTLDLFDINVKNYGFQLTFYNLDYKLNPRLGYEFYFESKIGDKKLIYNPNLEQEIFDSIFNRSVISTTILKFRYFIPVKAKSTTMLGIKSGLLIDKDTYKNQLFRIGGQNVLRGFNDESILTNSYVIVEIEYRYLIEKNSFFQLFCDLGVYENKFNDPQIKYPFGFGMGYSFRTRAGIFNISYSFGQKEAGQLSFSSGNLYFGISNLF